MKEGLMKYRPLFINGEWVEPTGGRKQDDINPATGKVNVQMAIASVEDVDKAVAAAKKAYYDFWYDTTVKERADMLFKIADRVDEYGEDFAQLESADAGKPISEARSEIELISETYRYFAGIARNAEGKSAQEYMKNITSYIRREPLGVTAGICPWNYPLLMMAWKLAPALAAGNTSIIKPASDTPMTALYFAEITKDLIPAGVLNVLTGRGGEMGDAICKHPDIQFVSMTGSCKTGKEIAKVSSQTLKRVHLELGGKAPVIVFDDADLDNVVENVKGAFVNSGQDCGQPCRVIVQASVYDEVVKRLADMANAVVVGDVDDPDVEMGPVVSFKQLEIVKGFVDRAVEAGGRVVAGGKPMDREGAYFMPTIIADLDQKDEIIQKEVFGPVVTVQKFETEEDAMFMANDVIYGLSASLYTSNMDRAMRMTRKLEFGAVWVNTHFVQPIEMPWGGYKQSG